MKKKFLLAGGAIAFSSFLLMSSCCFFVVLAAIGGGDPKIKEGGIGGRPIAASMTPEELYQAYALNEADADSRFLDKTVELVGVHNIQHQRVEKDQQSGIYYYTFRGSDWSPLFASPRPVVRVAFRASEIGKISNLVNGQKMVVRGTCSGKLVPDFSYGGKFVIVRDCTIE